VGLNVALLVLSASMRFIQINQGFLASIGVFLGFFTGCAVCAFLIFSALGTMKLAIALSIYPYQNLLNIGTVLLLSLTSFLPCFKEYF
jgi:xanthine/uracil permease